MDLMEHNSEHHEEWLLGYYFGTLEEPKRSQLEQQLLEDPALLGRFVALKRAMELGHTNSTPRPSSSAKQRLRQAVAKRYQPTLATKIWQWLRQPIPLYQGLVVALGFILLLTLALPSQPSTPTKTGPLIDSSSSGSEQLNWN